MFYHMRNVLRTDGSGTFVDKKLPLGQITRKRFLLYVFFRTACSHETI